MKKALIIGGGIGGPVAAVALQRAGIEAVVYEAHEAPAESLGLFLGLGINGMSALRELGLLDAVLRVHTIPTPDMEFRSTTGRLLGVVSNGWLDAETPSLTVMRGALQRALAEAATERGIEIAYGKRFVSAEGHRDGVTVRFSDGSVADGELLIGADGIHSQVRQAMFPEAPSPTYTGLLNVGGSVQGSDLPPTPGTMHMVWGRRAFFGYTVDSNGETWWFANVGQTAEPTGEQIAGIGSEGWRRELAGLFADDPPEIRRLIEATRTITATPIHDMPSLPVWWRERAVLMGDAAHAVSPSAGQGASMALEDAIMMAKCLRDLPDPRAALSRYEALRRPRAERIVREGRRRGTYKALESPAGIWLRDLLMPYAFRFFATPERMAWIYDYSITWDDPAEMTAPDRKTRPEESRSDRLARAGSRGERDA